MVFALTRQTLQYSPSTTHLLWFWTGHDPSSLEQVLILRGFCRGLNLPGLNIVYSVGCCYSSILVNLTARALMLEAHFWGIDFWPHQGEHLHVTIRDSQMTVRKQFQSKFWIAYSCLFSNIQLITLLLPAARPLKNPQICLFRSGALTGGHTRLASTLWLSGLVPHEWSRGIEVGRHGERLLLVRITWGVRW